MTTNTRSVFTDAFNSLGKEIELHDIRVDDVVALWVPETETITVTKAPPRFQETAFSSLPGNTACRLIHRAPISLPTAPGSYITNDWGDVIATKIDGDRWFHNDRVWTAAELAAEAAEWDDPAYHDAGTPPGTLHAIAEALTDLDNVIEHLAESLVNPSRIGTFGIPTRSRNIAGLRAASRALHLALGRAGHDTTPGE